MDVDSPSHAQAPSLTGHKLCSCKNTDSEASDPDSDAREGEHSRETGMGQDAQEQSGSLSPLGLDGAAASCLEVEDPFEIDPQDNEALVSLSKELESILDPKVHLHPSHLLLLALFPGLPLFCLSFAFSFIIIMDASER